MLWIILNAIPWVREIERGLSWIDTLDYEVSNNRQVTKEITEELLNTPKGQNQQYSED